MKEAIGIVALSVCAGMAVGGISDDFESYVLGGLPGGVWQDATSFIDEPTHTGDSVSVIQTTDAFGNLTNAVQINDHIGTSGGIMGRVEHTSVQRFEIDVRLDQPGNGSSPNWMSAVGFFQETDQTDFNWSPQAMVYASNNGRFRLFVQNADGRNSASRDFGMGLGSWSLDTWYRVSLEVDTENGIFDASVVEIATGEELSSTHRVYSGWNSEFGQYDLVSANDGEYGSTPGTRGNMATFDNTSYTPAPGALGVLTIGGLGATRRRRSR
tara:strand:- start:76754 stop:77560 length:807 start_codon:yes stop_codon:yes gene_type:complete